jgi:hypothetical protein
MLENRGKGANRGEFHRHWCFQGEHGQLDLEQLRDLNASKPRCPCNSIPETMPFVRLSWLLEPTTDLRKLPRLQDLPSEALVFPDEMSEAYFISHRWLERDHPDRTGQQMAVALSRTWAYNLVSPTARARRAGVWYDFMCLPQAPHTDSDRARMAELLPCVFFLPAISHPLVVLSGNSQLASRAWCVAEAVAAFLNGRHCEIASLSVQRLRYEALTRTSTPVRELLNKKTLGYEPGLSKLRAWIQDAGLDLSPKQDLTLEEGRNWKYCIDVVNRAAIALHLLMKRKMTSDFDSDRLLALANELGLETTEEDDLLVCMQAMAAAVRNYRKVDAP